jgi:hypothetical protein
MGINVKYCLTIGYAAKRPVDCSYFVLATEIICWLSFHTLARSFRIPQGGCVPKPMPNKPDEPQVERIAAQSPDMRVELRE